MQSSKILAYQVVMVPQMDYQEPSKGQYNAIASGSDNSANIFPLQVPVDLLVGQVGIKMAIQSLSQYRGV
jgi:hypothetical protein